LCAFIGLFGQWSPQDANSWEAVGFKGFLIIVVAALASYQLYRDKLDRSRAEVRHTEIQESLKNIYERLHEADKTGSQITNLCELQLKEVKETRSENAATLAKQWDVLVKERDRLH
jgi:hypothetical protein